MTQKLRYFLFSIICFSCYSQNIKLSEDAAVSIFTCGRGEELYSTFGHTALRIKDDANMLDVVYNYGTFDFNTENFYLKFVKGDLKYFMTVTSFTDFLIEYQLDRREVTEQVLNLSELQKQKLFDSLNAQLFSEDRYYTYKFIDRNCTTMVIDKINSLYDKNIIQKVDDTSVSYRALLYPYFDNFFWFKLGINIIFGVKTDQDSEKLFLPIGFFRSLAKTKVNGKPLVAETKTLVTGVEPKADFSFFNSVYIIIVTLFFLFIINKQAVFKSYLFLSGLLGLLLCIIGLYSQHEEVLWNYNAFLFNPLFLFIPFAKIRYLKNIILGSLVMLLIYSFIMISKPHLVIMLPFILTNLFVLLKINGRNPFRLLTAIKKNRT